MSKFEIEYKISDESSTNVESHFHSKCIIPSIARMYDILKLVLAMKTKHVTLEEKWRLLSPNKIHFIGYIIPSVTVDVTNSPPQNN